MFKQSTSGEHTQIIEGVHLKTTVYGENTLMTEVRLEKGAVIPPHKHAHEQTGYLIVGHMDFLVDGEHQEARPGDSWNIPGDMEHGATALEESLVIEVFSPVREDYLPYYTPVEPDESKV
jgi:quercetin dioxygenase-like cupin family protein